MTRIFRTDRLAATALFLALATLFLIANRGAYKGYFQDDELDNISCAPHTPPAAYLKALLSPRLSPVNFRPVGHFYFRVMGATAGLRFSRYVTVMHALHLVNVLLLWHLLRLAGAGPFTAGAGTLFFAFHMALFDAYWKPMYVFDVLTTLFCLLSLLAYAHRRWVLSFLCFWLAYKAKEIAVMLPAVMACWELWIGERRWKRLAPFFAVSAIFGLQGLFIPTEGGTDYTLQFHPAGLWKAVAFYSSKIFLVPYGGLLLVAAGFLVRDRRMWFGLAAAGFTLAPMLLLSNRLYAAYLYLPLACLALAFPALETRRARLIAGVFFAVWIPWNYANLIHQRRSALTIAADNRTYVQTLGEIMRAAPEVRTFLYDGAPPAMRRWGVEAAVGWFAGRGVPARVYAIDDPNLQAALGAPPFALLFWNADRRRLETLAHRPGDREASYLAMDRASPFWQLGEGWYPVEAGFRWIRPRATARLYRPPSATQFELSVNVAPQLIHDVGRTEVTVLAAGRQIGRHVFDSAGHSTVHWLLPREREGVATIEFRVSPEYRPSKSDPRVLGVALTSFGFR